MQAVRGAFIHFWGSGRCYLTNIDSSALTGSLQIKDETNACRKTRSILAKLQEILLCLSWAFVSFIWNATKFERHFTFELTSKPAFEPETFWSSAAALWESNSGCWSKHGTIVSWPSYIGTVKGSYPLDVQNGRLPENGLDIWNIRRCCLWRMAFWV